MHDRRLRIAALRLQGRPGPGEGFAVGQHRRGIELVAGELRPRILQGNFAPGFFVEHFLKDMAIILAESRRMNLIMPGVALAEQLYRCAQAQGHGRDGTQSLILALAEMTGVEWKR